MTPTTIFVLGIVVSAVVVIAGIYAVAIRRGPSAGPIPGDEGGRSAQRDRHTPAIRR